jgi:LPS-assembly protein
MYSRRKVRIKYNVVRLLVLTLFGSITLQTGAFDHQFSHFYNSLTNLQDTVPLQKERKPLIPARNLPPSGTNPAPLNPPPVNIRDTNPVIDTNQLVVTRDTLDVKLSKDSLDAPISYEAADSMVLMIKTKKIILYGKTNMKYKESDLKAPEMELDQVTQVLTAVNKKDSAGIISEYVEFTQGEENIRSDTMKFSMKTGKGYTQGVLTRQGEMFIQSIVAKRISADVINIYQGIITTCNLDHPHFAFRANKIKMINKKMGISGPVHPEFEGVPLPIYLPFGIYPLNKNNHSGLLPPQFTANQQFGLGLEGLGYYKVINDHLDVSVRTNIYSYGGFNLFLTPTYRKRYRYNGAVNLSYQRTKINFKGDPDFVSNSSYLIGWTHTVDSKARPGTTFSANVNAGSTKFNQFTPNNASRNFTNQLNSSINYSKSMTWGITPVNLNVSANHNQNNNLRLINISLPDVGFVVNTIYPFQKKEAVGTPKWYDKLGIGYNANFRNQLSFFDTSKISLRQLIDTLQWGAQHNIPIALSLPPLGPLQLAPTISFDQKFYAQKFTRVWNPTTKKVDSVISKGIFSSSQVLLGLNASTAIFGTFEFGKKSAIRAIRHVIRPTVGLNYKPDLAKRDYYTTQIDSFGNTFRFSRYEGSLYGANAEGRFGGIGFGVDNFIEMKVRNRKDTAEGGVKKVKIIDGFGFNGSYNLVADSFKLSAINLYVRSTLFNVITINAGATLDPYEFDSRGYRTKFYKWQQGRKFSPGSITNGNLSVSTSFSSKAKSDNKDKKRNEDPLTLDNQMQAQDYMRQNPAQFADFNVAWSTSFSYSLNFFRQFKADYSGFETTTTSNLTFQGDFNLTPKWKVGGNGFYDFQEKKIQSFTMFISRDMHCWQLAINVTPVGPFRFFNLTINPKSSILQDLKVTRTRYFYDIN